MVDELSERYAGLLSGSYDCVERIVLNGYFWLGHDPGGFRVWWRRWHGGSDETLDNTHLMRMAGRFSRRVRACALANRAPVIDCRRGERKHRIAEAYLREHPDLGPGVFLILVARAPAPVWDVRRSEHTGKIVNIGRKTAYVNRYSFHVFDPRWGHVTFTMCSHPPFDVQIMLNGPEYVAATAKAKGTSAGRMAGDRILFAVSDEVRLCTRYSCVRAIHAHPGSSLGDEHSRSRRHG